MLPVPHYTDLYPRPYNGDSDFGKTIALEICGLEWQLLLASGVAVTRREATNTPYSYEGHIRVPQLHAFTRACLPMTVFAYFTA